MSIRTIIAALALETEHDPVIMRALQLAHQHGARLVLVHVVEDRLGHDEGLPPSVDGEALRRMIVQAAGDRIRAMIDENPLEGEIDIIVETGRPYEVVDHIVQRERADILLIGPGNARSLREKMFGSTADRLVRIASRPVLVVRSAHARPYAHVAVAMDFSEPARAACEAAASLAGPAEIMLVHILEVPLIFEQTMLKAGTSTGEMERYRRGQSRAAVQRLAAFAAESPVLSVRPVLRVLEGDASVALPRLSRGGRTDLLALGVHGGNAVARALLGGVARRVLHQATCDILVASAKATQ